MRFLFILLTITLLCFQGFAAPQNKDQPAIIKSDLIDIKKKSQTINFIGNVRIEQGDDSMLADKIIVFYREKEDNKDLAKKEKIRIINASGNVRMFSEEFVATANKGSFDPNKNIFILEENVLVNKGTSAASGEKFIYNIKTKKSKFVGVNKNKVDDRKDKRAVVIIGGEDQKSD